MKKHNDKDIEEIYLELISPQNFRSNFKTKRAFIEWLEFGTIKDLECTLEKFVESQMFEDSCLIRDVINNKKFLKFRKNFHKY